MDVTRDNFLQALTLLRDAVSKADVIAVDTELTGLSDFSDRSDMLDSLDDRFLKLKSAAERFLVLQFGVATFEWVEKPNSTNDNNGYYVAKPFNFYVFPSKTVPTTDAEAAATVSSVIRDTIFSCQASSLDFLVANKFDFNKCFYKGVTYMSPAEEEIAKAKALVKGASFVDGDIAIDDTNRTFVELFVKEVTEWLQNSAEPRYFIKCSSPYHRRLIHQEVRKRFNGFLGTQSRGDKSGVDVRKLTEEERKATTNPGKEYSDSTLAAIEQAVGFRRVIQILEESKKPLVVHNGMLDMMHITTKFCKGGSACTSVSEWKHVVQSSFPVVFDTKVVGSLNAELSQLNQSTVLGDLMAQVSQTPFVSPRIVFHPLFKGYDRDDAFHDAGFDAFATGAVFLRMMGYLSLVRDEKATRVNLLRSVRLPNLEDEVMSSVVNKLFVMRSSIPFLNLSGADEDPNSNHKEPLDRSNVVSLTNVDTSTTTMDLLRAFQELGAGQVNVRWLNDTSCLVWVRDKSLMPSVWDTIKRFHDNPPKSDKLEKLKGVLFKEWEDEEPLEGKRKRDDSDEDDVKRARIE